MMEGMLEKADLPRHCVADLRRIIASLKQNSEEVSLGHTVYNHDNLPKCIGQLTYSRASKTKEPLFAVPPAWSDSKSATRVERQVLRNVTEKLQNMEGTTVSDGGVRRHHLHRHAELPLSAKEQDFIYRYAEYKHGTNIRNQEKKHTNSQAYQAYTEAFLSFTGRRPDDVEIREADRLPFVRTKDGTIGVIRKPRTSFPRRLVFGESSSRKQ
jgi:hypothetical protein